MLATTRNAETCDTLSLMLNRLISAATASASLPTSASESELLAFEDKAAVVVDVDVDVDDDVEAMLGIVVGGVRRTIAVVVVAFLISLK